MSFLIISCTSASFRVLDLFVPPSSQGHAPMSTPTLMMWWLLLLFPGFFFFLHFHNELPLCIMTRFPFFGEFNYTICMKMEAEMEWKDWNEYIVAQWLCCLTEGERRCLCKERGRRRTQRTLYERMVSNWGTWIGAAVTHGGCDCTAFLPMLIIFCLPLIFLRPSAPPVMKPLNHRVYI